MATADNLRISSRTRKRSQMGILAEESKLAVDSLLRSRSKKPQLDQPPTETTVEDVRRSRPRNVNTLVNQQKVDLLLVAEPDLSLEQVADKLQIGAVGAVRCLIQATRNRDFWRNLHKLKFQLRDPICTLANQQKVDQLLAAEPGLSIEDVAEKLNIGRLVSVARLYCASKDPKVRSLLHRQKRRAKGTVCTMANQAKVDQLVAAEPKITVEQVAEKLDIGAVRSVARLYRASRCPEYRRTLHGPKPPAKAVNQEHSYVDLTNRERTQKSQAIVPRRRVVVLTKIKPSEILTKSQRQKIIRINLPSGRLQTTRHAETKPTVFYNCAQCDIKSLINQTCDNCTESSSKKTAKKKLVKEEIDQKIKLEECESELTQNRKHAEGSDCVNNLIEIDDFVKQEPLG